MTTSTEPIFKLTSFTPVGFKVRNYPIDMCMLCRGELTSVCYMCQEKGCSTCEVITDNEIDFHSHCFKYIKANTKKKEETGKKKS